MIKIEKEIMLPLEGSKSILNRLMIIATMLDNPLRFRNFSKCLDIQTMSDNLAKLGYEIIDRTDYYTMSSIHQPPEKVKLYVQDSATAFRFLLVRLAAWPGLLAEINVSHQLKKRPIKPLLNILKQLGAYLENEDFPIITHGKNLTGRDISLTADISSQFISSLMLIAPQLPRGIMIKTTGEIVSQGYIQMTAKIMREFGIKIEQKNNFIRIAGGQEYKQQNIFNVEPDYSSACYYWAVGALSDKWIATAAVGKEAIQPDFYFWKILRKMGAEIKFQNEMIWIRHKEMNGLDVDMSSMPDQVPTLAVLSILADSSTVMKKISHLKHKESDRINSLRMELKKLNVKTKYAEGSLTIFPTKRINENAILDAHNDHRLAMSFYILKLFYPNIKLSGLDSIKKSNPDYEENINSISLKS